MERYPARDPVGGNADVSAVDATSMYQQMWQLMYQQSLWEPP